jgi:hypothetical protein
LSFVSVTLKDEKASIIFQGTADPNVILMVVELPADNYHVQGILNEVTTPIAMIGEVEFSKELIERFITHNDPRFTISGNAMKAHNGQAVAGFRASCENTVLNKTSNKTTTADGKFSFQLEQSRDFKVADEMQGWLSSEVMYEATKGLDRK